jgi:predicted anti-sigma-YlaC factor YlaD
VNDRRHLDDDEIAAAADDERVRSSGVERHLAQCAPCRAAVGDAIAIRAFVARSATRDVVPEHDLARPALAAIRARDEAVAGVNEAFGTFGAVVRSLVGFALGRQR